MKPIGKYDRLRLRLAMRIAQEIVDEHPDFKLDVDEITKIIDQELPLTYVEAEERVNKVNRRYKNE